MHLNNNGYAISHARAALTECIQSCITEENDEKKSFKKKIPKKRSIIDKVASVIELRQEVKWKRWHLLINYLAN